MFQVCPFLLRVFVSTSGHHHKTAEYMKGNVPENELQMYTWKDATLSELAILVKKVSPEARRKGTKLSYALVYPDVRSQVYRMRDIGATISGQKGPDDLKTLGQVRLTVGDYMDIAIISPEPWNNSPRKGFSQPYNNHRQRPY